MRPYPKIMISPDKSFRYESLYIWRSHLQDQFLLLFDVQEIGFTLFSIGQ